MTRGLEREDILGGREGRQAASERTGRLFFRSLAGGRSELEPRRKIFDISRGSRRLSYMP